MESMWSVKVWPKISSEGERMAFGIVVRVVVREEGEMSGRLLRAASWDFMEEGVVLYGFERRWCCSCCGCWVR